MKTQKRQRIAVLGAGMMGSQIAGLFAGLGFEVHLLDVVSSEKNTHRHQAALRGLEKLSQMKPSPLYRRSDLKRIQLGNFDDDLERCGDCDWIIEAIVERLEIKQELYARLDPLLQEKTIISSNTSGLSLASLLEGRSDHFRRRFCVTHFFNPPRYLKLLELVVSSHADADVIETVQRLAHDVLGKGIVFAKDTPNFIANRIGVFHFLDVIHLTEESGWPLEAVDAVLGPATAHPKSAIFRTADLVGLDTLTFVAETVFKGCPQDEQVRRMRIPQFLQKMITKGWTGQKNGRGFYYKDPETKVLRVIDPASLDYRAVTKLKTPSLHDARSIEDPAIRLRRVVFAEDQAGEIAWPALSRTLVYAANRIPEIADDIVQIDRALRWGFNWELGPFEMWDVLGVKEMALRLEKDHLPLPQIVTDLLRSNHETFYTWRNTHRSYFDVKSRDYVAEPGTEKHLSFKRLKMKKECIVTENAGASLLDLHDGVFCCEFHTKMNAIDDDVISMLNTSLDHVEKEGVGLLIANQGVHFCAGANLLLVLMLSQQKQWEELDQVIRRFQSVMQRIRFATKPVIAVPFQMTLGGGCEIVLAAGRTHASAETYIGLVEVGAGIIPAGGGCKNMLLRYDDLIRRHHDPKDKIWFSAEDGGPFPKVKLAFETIGTAKVATSAFEAREFCFLQPEDRITLDSEELILNAKAHLLELTKAYIPPVLRKNISLPGLGGKMALLNALTDWKKLGKISDYDMIVGEKLAHLLSGGDRPSAHLTDEQHLLDLEREAFLSLCGNPQTHERMAHLLQTGKPLRN